MPVGPRLGPYLACAQGLGTRRCARGRRRLPKGNGIFGISFAATGQFLRQTYRLWNANRLKTRVVARCIPRPVTPGVAGSSPVHSAIHPQRGKHHKVSAPFAILRPTFFCTPSSASHEPRAVAARVSVLAGVLRLRSPSRAGPLRSRRCRSCSCPSSRRRRAWRRHGQGR